MDRKIGALDAFQIDGIGHNVDFLSALMQHPRFRAGNLTTGFIGEEYPHGFTGAPADAELKRILAAFAAGIACSHAARAYGISGQLGATRPALSDWVVRLAGEEMAVTLCTGHAMVGGNRIDGEMQWEPGDRFAHATANGSVYEVQVARAGVHWRLTTRGASHVVQVLPPHIAALSRHMIEKVPPDLSKFLIAPMPGLLTALHVGEGDHVEAGQPLAVVEAMKMENILRAEKAGTVKAVQARPGESLAVDAVIVEFE